MYTFGPLIAKNARSGRLLGGAPVTVTTLDGTTLDTYTVDERPLTLVTNHEGYAGTFTADTDQRVILARPRGGDPLPLYAHEGIQDAAEAADTINTGRLSEDALKSTIAAETAPIAEASAAAYLASEPGVVDAATQAAVVQVQQAIADEGSIADPVIATAVATRGSNTRTALADAIDPVASRGDLSPIVSLIAGTEDEVPTVLTPLDTRTPDTVNYIVGRQGWKQTRSSAGTILQGYDGPLDIPPFQAVCLWVHVPDAAAYNDIGVRLYFDEGFTTEQRWSRAFSAPPATPIVDGWNFFRVPADWSGLDITDRTTLYRWEVYGVTNTTLQQMTVGHLYLETPARAKCFIVADRGYQRFYEGLYQDLKARGIPVTWAVDVTLFGTGTPGGASEAITEDLLHTVARENGNSVSFHGWDGAPTVAMSPAELRIDTAKAVKWLQKHGYEGRMWRAAYVQNAATAAAHAAAKDLLVGASTPRSISGLTPWPPQDMHDIPRYAMDNNRSLAEITSWFDWMRKTRMTGNIFVHSEHETNQYDYSAERRAHFLAEIDAALADGSVEFTTFEEAYRSIGGVFRSTGGAHLAEYTDPSGARITRHVM